jgi:HD superfamily phosphohydrolase YqeK
MDEFGVPLHIRKHNVAVAKLGVFLAKKLKEKGISVDVDLVDRACLLHDLLRICDPRCLLPQARVYARESGCGGYEGSAEFRIMTRKSCHEDAAYELLKDKYPELALAVRRHRYAALLDEKDKPVTWEEKIVYYADKRVMHDGIVPLKERLEEAHRRNVPGRNCANQAKLDSERIDAAIFELEREILDKIGLEPHEVTAGRNISRTGKSSGTDGT